MKSMTSEQIRIAFKHYFEQLNHTPVSSSSLVPANDPTLLFTNSGMVQFKDTFLGLEERPYQRAVSVQRCVRAGGKHNDLENVGHTKRHHTFFEMLGNFSFGDYFKREAIHFAWNFLTHELKIPAERLWITVYKDDPESESIWLQEMKISPQRLTRCGEKDNFWSMGEVGPCGPCTEIFYDHGPSIPGGPPGSPNHDDDRYVEIWNLVFMQFDRNIAGKLKPLPKPCVDTGMGLERIAAVMQGVHDNYDIDTFKFLLNVLSQLIGYKDQQSPSMRVIVDHIRSISFLIADGVIPSNESRGYVLRRIIRRAVRHGYKLGQQKPFLHHLVDPLVECMGDTYPEIVHAKPLIQQLIKQEEEQFSHTLENGLKVFDEIVQNLASSQIPGDVVFQLYDTFGFPIDLTGDLAKELNLSVDYVGFEKAMEKQRSQSQQTHQFKALHTQQLHIPGVTEFTGYDKMEDESEITALLQDERPVNQLDKGQKGIVTLTRTPFYAESGGQVGDTGIIYSAEGQFKVKDTQKHGQVYLHYGFVLEGKLRLHDAVRAVVDPTRFNTMLNHSATHLLHEALRRILGVHVTQKGSFVAPDHLRFDFACSKPLTLEQIKQIEGLVNQEIHANLPTTVEEHTLEDAKKKGAVALFGEKYGARVRVVAMGNFSQEVCGGTHVHHTSQIGLFKITSQSALASGIRRLEAVTGQYALDWINETERLLQDICATLKIERAKVTEKISQILIEQKNLVKELAQLKQQFAVKQGENLLQQVLQIGEIQLLAVEVKAHSREDLRHTLDMLKQKIPSGAIILATIIEDKVQLIAWVSKHCLPYFTAVELLNQVTSVIDGRGGGKPDLAQGGGDNPSALPTALKKIPDWIKNKIAA